MDKIFVVQDSNDRVCGYKKTLGDAEKWIIDQFRSWGLESGDVSYCKDGDGNIAYSARGIRFIITESYELA